MSFLGVVSEGFGQGRGSIILGGPGFPEGIGMDIRVGDGQRNTASVLCTPQVPHPKRAKPCGIQIFQYRSHMRISRDGKLGGSHQMLKSISIVPSEV